MSPMWLGVSTETISINRRYHAGNEGLDVVSDKYLTTSWVSNSEILLYSCRNIPSVLGPMHSTERGRLEMRNSVAQIILVL